MNKHIIYTFVSGAVLPLAFAPFRIWPIACLSVLIFINLLDKNPKNSKLLGFSYGLGQFGIGTSWVFHSIYFHSATSLIISLGLTLLFICYLALFPSCLAWLWCRYFSYQKDFLRIISFPTLWLLMEGAISHVFSGFPWLLLGYTHVNSPLSPFAPIIGVYGLSFLTALLAIVGLELYKNKQNIYFYLIIIIIFCVATLFKSCQWTTKLKEHTVSMVQGNLSPSNKYLLTNPYEAIWEAYVIPSQKIWKQAKTELIIWPEAALPVPLPYSEQFIKSLEEQVIKYNIPLVLGLFKETEDKQGFYSIALLLNGKERQIYKKRKLVLFGEYIPFDSILRGLIEFFNLPLSTIKQGPANGKAFNLSNLRILPLICYDIAYPATVRQMINKNLPIEALLQITEEAWFGDTWGAKQHLDIVRMRAQELGMPIIRAGSSGITAVINADGAVQEQLAQFTHGTLTVSYTSRTNRTPWLIYGNLPIWITAVLLLAFIILKIKIDNYRQPGKPV